MTGRYAQATTVSTDRSRSEIQRRLEQAGATNFRWAFDPGVAQLGFCLAGRLIRITLPLPIPDDYTITAVRQQRRSAKEVKALWEQGQRQAWRQLALVIKAKLEAIAAGITTVEMEFLGNLVLDAGQTVFEALATERGQLPAAGLLLGSG